MMRVDEMWVPSILWVSARCELEIFFNIRVLFLGSPNHLLTALQEH